MIHKTQQQQTLILTGLKLKMTHQKRERNQNIDLEKVGVMETEESCQAKFQMNWRKIKPNSST